MKKKLLFLLTAFALLGMLSFCVCATYNDMRPNYGKDPAIRIVNGVAYAAQRVWTDRTKTESYIKEYHVIDYFATNKLAKSATKIKIVSNIDGIPVTAITTYYSTKTRNETVTALSIPNSVTRINQLFLFSALKTVKLPANLEQLEGGCFARMENLQEIVLPKQLQAVPSDCFKHCKKLKSVKFRGAPETIGINAFYGCSALEDIEIPAGVRHLHNGAFAKSGIHRATISTECILDVNRIVSDINDNDSIPIFYACKNLTDVFFQGDGLYNVVSSIYIPHDTFRNCTALRRVILPACRHLTVGENAFMNCKALEQVGNSEYIEFAPAGAFRNCTALKRIEIGNWADRIGADTFKGCTGLQKLILKTDNVLLFDARYPRYSRIWSGNFLRYVPKTCRVYVPNDTMQQAVVSHGFNGKVIVKEMKDIATNIFDPV